MQTLHGTNTANMVTSMSSQASMHSRDGSNTSSISMPITPTFSARSHGHWTSSSSSLAGSPVMTKSPLGDLLEETEEHDDALSVDEAFDDQICMCETAFCIHEPRSAQRQSTEQPSLPEWSRDDAFTSLPQRSKRRISNEYSMQAISNKFSRRFSSISRRWRDSQPTTSLSLQQRSATPPRSSSLRLPKVKSSLASVLDSPPRSDRSDRSLSISESLRQMATSPMPIDITAPPTPIEEEPIDRQSMSRTPLLPPLLSDFRSQSDDHMMRSPLQSPSVASSAIQSPVSAPAMGIYTPPLSTSPSIASIAHANHFDIPPMDLGVETDPWSLKLGHANFTIYPEPYIPQECNKQTCQRLLEDWEAARVEYMRQAARVSDDYGSNSQTYHFTEEKWAEIDAQWRANHKLANETAEASGETIKFQPLAETAPPQKMPVLSDDPNAPAKFPVINESDIVGPMVQYAKIAGTSPAKKPNLLRLFTGSASLLSRSPFQLRR